MSRLFCSTRSFFRRISWTPGSASKSRHPERRRPERRGLRKGGFGSMIVRVSTAKAISSSHARGRRHHGLHPCQHLRDCRRRHRCRLIGTSLVDAAWLRPLFLPRFLRLCWHIVEDPIPRERSRMQDRGPGRAQERGWSRQPGLLRAGSSVPIARMTRCSRAILPLRLAWRLGYSDRRCRSRSRSPGSVHAAAARLARSVLAVPRSCLPPSRPFMCSRGFGLRSSRTRNSRQ